MDSSLYLAVHPGYAFESDEYQELGLRPEDYFRHNHEFFGEFEKDLESDADIAVMEETGTEYSRDYLGGLSEEVDHWFETVQGEAKLKYDNADEFIDVVRGLDEEAVTVSGEIHNLCQGQAVQIIEYVAEKEDVDIDVRRGVVFPERPLQRDDNNDLEFV
ncbi:hypothetical protein ACK3SF_03050 [Candidatus Nanosalina sp. VS9-1]|uniref:hypothetical protein n=1 Tax=Candidatus Nanosalina sp. VS9-1 TaxID=3388566 RepID=UPI0039E1AAF6